MTNNNNEISVILIVIIVAAVLMGIQSCMFDMEPISDDIIVEVGRARFMSQLPSSRGVEIIEERVLRPGVGGKDYGYWVRYTIKDANGVLLRKDYYDE